VIPPWLRGRGGDPTRGVKLRLCHQCGTVILVGLDADRCAVTANVDPTPLTEFGEAVALITGRGTYDLVPADDRKELHCRNASHIKKPRRYLVFGDHQCEKPLAAFAQPIPEKRRTTDDQPAF
jgi:hypothetical protein